MTSPYASVAPLLGTAPSWIGNSDEATRIMSYGIYEDIYWNVPESFKLVMRGDDESPIYLPTARKIVEATHRFLAINFDFVVNDKIGTSGEQAALELIMRALFKREEIYAKVTTQKRYGLIKGDALWHITADPGKALGSRIAMHELDPAMYFPIHDEDNPDRVIGCHIAKLVPDPKDKNKSVVRRQTYRKMDNNRITSELALFEVAKWDDRRGSEIKRVQSLVDEFELPAQITTIPVYHIKNNRVPGEPFGSSQLRGIETILSGMDQSISDQAYTLAMQGLGVYVTTAGPPIDAEGNEGNIEMGPGRAIEIGEDEDFKRVSGVGSVAPFLDHIGYLDEAARTALGIGDLAAGKVEVSVAESGISLRLQLAPLLAANAEKESELLGKYDHLFFDLSRGWLPAYEEFSGGLAEVASVVGDPLPVNREAEIEEARSLFSESLITFDMLVIVLAKHGYVFPENAREAVLGDATEFGAVRNPDPFGARLDTEGEDSGNTDEE